MGEQVFWGKSREGFGVPGCAKMETTKPGRAAVVPRLPVGFADETARLLMGGGRPPSLISPSHPFSVNEPLWEGDNRDSLGLGYRSMESGSYHFWGSFEC